MTIITFFLKIALYWLIGSVVVGLIAGLVFRRFSEKEEETIAKEEGLDRYR